MTYIASTFRNFAKIAPVSLSALSGAHAKRSLREKRKIHEARTNGDVHRQEGGDDGQGESSAQQETGARGGAMIMQHTVTGTLLKQPASVRLDALVDQAAARISEMAACKSIFVNVLPRNLEVPVDEPAAFFALLKRLMLAASRIAAEGDFISITAESHPALIDLRLDVSAPAALSPTLPGMFTREECETPPAIQQKLTDIWHPFRLVSVLAEGLRLRCFFSYERPGLASLHCLIPLLPLHRAGQGDQSKVLIVEDNPQLLTLFRFALSMTDCMVLSARDGIEGLALARRYVPNVITTSVMMPRKDGFELLRELREHPSTAGIPVLMVSVLREYAASFRQGAADHILKPVSVEAYRAAVRRFTVLRHDLSPAVMPILHRVVVVGPMTRGTSVLDQGWHETVVLKIDAGRADAFGTLVRADHQFSLVVFDCREDLFVMLPFVSLALLHPSIRGVPSVAVYDQRNSADAAFWLDGLVNRAYLRGAFTIDAVRADLGFQ
jgi:DNA-binding response OmpR family regulator